MKPSSSNEHGAAPRRSFWDAYETFLKRSELLFKPIALLLVIAGLAGFYIPQLRRIYEETVMPAASYQIGIISRSADKQRIRFLPAAYDSPAWSNGLNAKRVFGLPGSEIRTTDTAVGRAAYDVDTAIVTILPKDQCLHVLDVAFSDYVPGGHAYGASTLDGIKPDASAEARLRLLTEAARQRGAKDCQTYTEQEVARHIAAGEGGKTARSFRSGVAICPRTAVWIRAQKVTC